MRTVVKVNPGRHPELFEELEQLSDPTGRAERLRMLATIGLRSLLNRSVPDSPSESVKIIEQQVQKEPRAPHRRPGTPEHTGETRKPDSEQELRNQSVRENLLKGMANQF